MITVIGDQQSKIEVLLKLIKENPDLEILPMVDNEVGNSDYSFNLGSWGKASVEDYYIGEELIYFKSEERLEEDVYCRLENENPSWSDEYLEEQLEKEMAEIEWQKAIVVYINPAY